MSKRIASGPGLEFAKRIASRSVHVPRPVAAQPVECVASLRSFTTIWLAIRLPVKSSCARAIARNRTSAQVENPDRRKKSDLDISFRVYLLASGRLNDADESRVFSRGANERRIS